MKELHIKARSVFTVVGTLSGGNQQKVVLAKWLLTNPKVLFLDEPTRGIDVGAKAEIYELMTRLAAQGTAIVMASSELPEVLGMSTRIGVMRGGRIVLEGAAGEKGRVSRRAGSLCAGAEPARLLPQKSRALGRSGERAGPRQRGRPLPPLRQRRAGRIRARPFPSGLDLRRPLRSRASSTTARSSSWSMTQPPARPRSRSEDQAHPSPSSRRSPRPRASTSYHTRRKTT